MTLVLLLLTILAPPVVDHAGHHASKQWSTVKQQYAKRHPSMRCRMCYRKGETTYHVLSVVMKGWIPHFLILKRTRKRNHLHELGYAWKHHPGMLTDFWLMWLCPTCHKNLHLFDKWLLPWDQRNRFLWLTTLLVVYVPKLAVLVALSFGLHLWRPEIVTPLVNAVR